ncbi:MAG TPA: tRNA lysidine(34) synthetase TilS, partial [Sedimentisphaerales bacterium]|nr:tRNA lysidine(34) synthetase TilS [Sedimentisphaerales bacterium]
MDMLLEFEKKVADFIDSQNIFASADKILLAVSGGADSTALLYLMAALKDHSLLHAELFCAHINHQLRGADSDADQNFVAAQTQQLHVPLTIAKVDVRGFARENNLSLETAARKLRIEALSQIAAENNCTHIALGHQKNDNAETVLHRLLRGTGPRGLAGIWPVRSFAPAVNFARPLLCVTRPQILDYLNSRHLQWRTDRTNRNCTYKRNYIRHRLLSAIQQQQSSSVIDQLYILSQSAQRLDKLISQTVQNIWPTVAESGGSEV